MNHLQRTILLGLLICLFLLVIWTWRVRGLALDASGSPPIPPPVSSGAVRGIVGDTWADVVLGQPDFSSLAPNEVTGDRIFNGGGVIVDRSVCPNRLHMYDGGNRRVLGLSHLGPCQAGVQRGERCTTDSDCPGSACDLQVEPPFGPVGADGEGRLCAFRGDRILVYRLLITNGEQPVLEIGFPLPVAGGGSLRATELATVGLAVSGDGERLWVRDPAGSRVLRIRNPVAHPVVDVVLGQLDPDGGECNRGA